MIERSTKLDIRHRKSNKPYSELQKLNIYYNMQMFRLKGAHSNLSSAIRENADASVKTHLWDAIRSIAAAIDHLTNEYNRDRTALVAHNTETAHHE
jgi:hypothetical protein